MSHFKFVLAFCFFTLANLFSYAQTVNKCGTTEYMDYLKQQDPNLTFRMDDVEQRMQQYISNNRTAAVPLQIRVVVHVVWHMPFENISDAQVLSQIDALNEDFSRNNADTLNTPSVFLPFAASSDIHFCMATEDPNGNPTNGIVRVQTPVISFSNNNDVKFTSMGGSDAWDPSSYLNIWVCNLFDGERGYAQLPGGFPATSGAVIKYNTFGTTGVLLYQGDLGRAATHTIGHVFNLRHLSGDFQCGDDYVNDTPTELVVNFLCPSFPNVSCSNGPDGDMFMNFMELSADACLNMFTLGQVARMRACINSSYSGWLSNYNCIPYLHAVTGKVYYDANQNGMNDAGDPGMINRKVLMLPDSVILTTNSAGYYRRLVESGPYSLKLIPDPQWNQTSSPAVNYFQVDTLDICCKNFGIFPVAVSNHVSIDYTSSQLRCGFTVPSWINLTNDGTSIVSGTIRFIPDDSMTFVSSYPLASVSSGDTLYFDYSNLAPGQTYSVYLVYEMPLTPGIELCTNTLAYVFDGTINQPFVENQYCDNVTCSFDPNDKQVKPPGVQAAHYILKSDSLLYTIRFQNMGTDTAFTVVVRDQLSNLLNRYTIELVSSSHPVTLSVNSNNLAEFRFDNILLPYKAINEPGSNGFVKFRILPVAGLPDGTVINNDAGIYFDYNAPVITNTTFVTLVTTIPVGINEMENETMVSIIPQPFTNHCEIVFSTENTTATSYQIFDLAGRKFAEGKSSEGIRKTIHLETSEWKNGIYFIRITGADGTVVQTEKLVKL